MTTPEPVTDTTEDPRLQPVAEFVLQQYGSVSGSEVPRAGHYLMARRFLAAVDAADAAAGIRRVTAEEWVEPSDAEVAAAMEAVSYLHLVESDLTDAVYDVLRAAAHLRIGGAS